RRRVRYQAIDGPDITGAIADTIEGKIPVTLNQYKTVPISFDSTELTLEVEEFTERYIRPAMIELVQQVESSIADTYKEIWWFTGTPGTAPADYVDIGAAEAILDDAGVPFDGRSAFYTPQTMVQLADGLKGVFPTSIATLAIERSSIGVYANFDVIKCQSLKRHTVGPLGGTPLVDGAGQDVTYLSVKDTYSQTLDTLGWTAAAAARVNEGDVFTIADVYSVNPRTRQSTGNLQPFVIREDGSSDSSGNLTLTISPPIIISGPYQTVDSSPADNAALTILTGTAGAQYPQNIAFNRNAITCAMAQLAAPEGGARYSRQTMDNISIRYVEQFDILTDVNVKRFDILYGVLAQNPGMAIRTTS
ncbi:MAG: hypothetical protein GY751_01500, partial [Bacteroidetes bacterium]|nr:hypothetical protein [Bacteroidota bacterium]